MSSVAKVVLWGTGYDYHTWLSYIKMLEETEHLYVVGVVTKEDYFVEYDGFRLIRDIGNEEFDYIICMSTRYYLEILREANLLGISGSKVIRIDVLGHVGFSFEKWDLLYSSRLSIIAINCWGGVTYNYFGLPFLSPFINMCEDEEGFMSFCEGDIRKTLSGDIKFLKVGYQPVDKITYPIYELDNMTIYMNHYNDCIDAEYKWRERTEKINYDNLLIMMFTESVENAERFSQLKYDKKICFTSFDSRLPSCLTVYPYTHGGNRPFWRYIIDMAKGVCTVYDPWELLLYGNIVLRGKI